MSIKQLENTNLKRMETHVTSEKFKKKPCCDRWLIHPDKAIKIYWDLFIILASIWNSILIPYEASRGEVSTPIITVPDRVIDVLFVFDIIFNLRTIYRDSKTDEEVHSGKKIALRYILGGRFWVDLLASIPLEVFGLVLKDNTE